MQYKAPLRDIQFVMHELLDSESHYKTLPAFQEADRELMDSLFEMAASFAENELSPLNQSGDAEGSPKLPALSRVPFLAPVLVVARKVCLKGFKLTRLTKS